MRFFTLVFLMLLFTSNSAFSQAPAEHRLPHSFTEVYLQQQNSTEPREQKRGSSSRSGHGICEQGSYLFVDGLNADGSFPRGQPVEFYYQIVSFEGYNYNEWLHAVEVNFGEAWDWQENFTVLETPQSCYSIYGEWNWYPEWQDCIDYETHGPGFAFSNFTSN